MSQSNTPKLGNPVLLYLTPSAPLSLSFGLQIRYSIERNEASLMLGTLASPFLQGATDKDAFVVQCDADNIDYTTPTNAYAHAHLQVAAPRLLQLERNHVPPHLVCLTLRLKAPCPLWGPRFDALVPAASPSAQAAFQELTDLAKATTLHLAINQHWLSDERRGIVHDIRTGSKPLSFFPVAEYYSKFFKKLDWTDFSPQTPPTKRPRESSPPSSPPEYKRTHSNRSPSPNPIPSSTEAATSPSKAVDDTVERLLPDLVHKYFHIVAEQRLPDLAQHYLAGAVKLHLPGLLVLPKEFPSYASSDIHTSPPPGQDVEPSSRDLTPLGRALMPFFLDHLRPQVQNMISRSLNCGVESNKTQAILEINQVAEDMTTDVQQVKRSALEEMEKDANKFMDDLRQRTESGVAALQQETDNGQYYVEARGKRWKAKLEQEMLESVAEVEREKDDAVKDLYRTSGIALDELKEKAIEVQEDIKPRMDDRAAEIVDGHLQGPATAVVAAVRNDLRKMKNEAMKEMRNKGMKEMRGEVMKQMKDEIMKQMKGEIMKQMKGEIMKQMKDEGMKEMKDEMMKQMKGEMMKQMRDEAVRRGSQCPVGKGRFYLLGRKRVSLG